ncbi:MAG: DUF4843 domain-containing protein [Odoribacteraceae bacterium]|jgi:hypothetical protein|nr:DUF4843 domain-containing protein [Odoribacteraceae bacterium]
MNTAKYITLIAAVAAAGCTGNGKFFYDTSAAALNIWLGREAVVADSLTYNFAYQKEHDSIVFYARLSGLPSDVDRAFRLEAVEGDSALVHYRTIDYILPAGAYQAAYPLYIDKPDGYDAFKERDGRVVFKVKENPHFAEGAVETNRLHVVFKNYVGKPDNWDVATYPYRPLSTYFGVYSDVKYSFVIQVTGRSNFKIYYTTSPTAVLADDEVTALEATDMKNRCKIALLEHNATHGTLLDENNEPVTFP